MFLMGVRCSLVLIFFVIEKIIITLFNQDNSEDTSYLVRSKREIDQLQVEKDLQVAENAALTVSLIIKIFCLKRFLEVVKRLYNS